MLKLFKLINLFLKDLFSINFITSNLYSFYKNLFTFDFYQLDDIEYDEKERELNDKEKLIFFNYGSRNVREYYFDKFIKQRNFTDIDIFWTKIFSRKYFLKKNTNIFRSYFRVFSSNKGFYFNLLNLKKKIILIFF